MNRSPERGSFHIECELKRVEEGETTPEKAQEMIEFYKSWEVRRCEIEATDEWKVDNMEYDLRSTDWICNKAKLSEAYAQNLYAAMCNRDFVKNDVWPILTDNRWSCSWRHAGGIIADIQQEGDYIDWYCSGIGGVNAEYDAKETADEWSRRTGYVPEGKITEEIREDLKRLGWVPAKDGDWEHFE